MKTDRIELLAIQIALLTAQTKLLQSRVRALEVAHEARIHVLELMLARLSHEPQELVTQPRRTIDDRGNVIRLRAPAA